MDFARGSQQFDVTKRQRARASELIEWDESFGLIKINPLAEVVCA